MPTDRILGNARGPYAWFLISLVLLMACGSAYGWFKWGEAIYLIGAVAMVAVAVAGMIRLRKLSHDSGPR